MTNPPCHIADTDKEAVHQYYTAVKHAKLGFVRGSKQSSQATASEVKISQDLPGDIVAVCHADSASTDSRLFAWG
jgi:hypothetical protein